MSDDVLFELDPTKLLIGDILLTASPGERTSDWIRIATGADFSHAILVSSINPPLGIESSNYGVVEFQLDRFAVRDPSNIALRRVRRDLLSVDQIANAVKAAEKLISRQYPDWELLFALFRWMPPLQPGQVICSQLICEAFHSVGLDLVPDVRPGKTTPGMLADSAVLEGQAFAFLRPILMEDEPAPRALLDASNPRSPLEHETEAKQDVVRRASPVFKKHGHSILDFNTALETVTAAWSRNEPQARDLDQALASGISESELLTFVDRYFWSENDIFSIGDTLAKTVAFERWEIERQKTFLDFYRARLKRTTETQRGHDRSVDTFRQIYEGSQLESYRLLLALHTHMQAIGLRILSALKAAIQVLEGTISHG